MAGLPVPGIAGLAAVFVAADQCFAFGLTRAEFVTAGCARCGRSGQATRRMLTGDFPRQPFGIMVLSFAFVVTVTGCQRPRAAIGCQTGADAGRYRRCGQDPAAEPATVPGASKISLI